MDIWQTLAQFIFRLTFGVALAMGITPASLVTSGFYRVHLWVLMALNTFAALAVHATKTSYADGPADWSVVFGLAVAIAVLSYLGSVVWLYSKSRAGGVVLYVIALAALVAAALATHLPTTTSGLAMTMILLDLISGGLLLGVTLSAMLLGHWYLNTPTMELIPLRRLVLLMVSAILARTLVSGFGLVLQIGTDKPASMIAFIVLRWLSGLLGTMVLAVMTWKTLKIPNTQSATGILYAGVILAFIGELTSMLLSVGTPYPL